MNFVDIDDIQTPQLEVYRLLRDRAISHDNSFIADSPKVVNLLLQTDIRVHSILATKEYYEEFESLIQDKNIPKLYVTSKEQMQNIVGHKIHHNCMMHGVRPDPTALEGLDDQIIMLDEITSTENIGSIARSAAALGVSSYLLPRRGPHPYGRRALRVSMGHMSMLKIHMYDDIEITIEALQSLGYKVFAAEVADDAVSLSQLEVPQKWVLLMGHEGKGIAKEILNLCDTIVTVEMVEGVKSFNVAVAASIMMYQFQHSLGKPF